MNPLFRALEWTASTFNDLRCWKRECRVWDLRLASPTFERWLYLQAHRLGLMGKAERDLFARAIRPGMRILDIGGNIGLYSLFLARLAGPSGRVISFEPEPDLFAALLHNQTLNASSGLEAHNLALGTERGQLTLHRSIINSGDNHLGAADGDLFRRTVPVEVVALDAHFPGLQVDFVKIDVQGWELQVLSGMRGTLAANPDVRIYFEFSPAGYARGQATYQDLIAFLRGADFRIFDPVAVRELDDTALVQLARRLGANGYTNLLASRLPPADLVA